jgi:hypothetical protein
MCRKSLPLKPPDPRRVHRRVLAGFLEYGGGSGRRSGSNRDARIPGLSRFDTLRKVVLPASVPHSFSGMAVGLALSFILLTVAELFGANAGVGGSSSITQTTPTIRGWWPASSTRDSSRSYRWNFWNGSGKGRSSG